tara:strand:- start:242 stop:805 length:564 start_codon:yes stop_codon:yes gene_type:complete
MKKISLVLLATLSFSFLPSSKVEIKKVNISNSTIKWVGYKLTGKHEGTITLKKGELMFENNTLVGGKFIMDMTSINTTDLGGGSKERLDGHLKSEDFFDSYKFKTATMVFENVKPTTNGYRVNANLTIKNITKPVVFNMEVSGNSAKTKLKIDRTKFNITYKSATMTSILKDKAIYDEFDLSVSLKF